MGQTSDRRETRQGPEHCTGTYQAARTLPPAADAVKADGYGGPINFSIASRSVVASNGFVRCASRVHHSGAS